MKLSSCAIAARRAALTHSLARRAHAGAGIEIAQLPHKIDR